MYHEDIVHCNLARLLFQSLKLIAPFLFRFTVCRTSDLERVASVWYRSVFIVIVIVHSMFIVWYRSVCICEVFCIIVCCTILHNGSAPAALTRSSERICTAPYQLPLPGNEGTDSALHPISYRVLGTRGQNLRFTPSREISWRMRMMMMMI